MTTATLPSIGIMQAARIIGVSGCTVRRWMKSGHLRAVRIGGKYRTTREWIDELCSPVGEIQIASNGVNDHDDGYDSAIRNLRIKFGMSTPEMSRSGLQASGEKSRSVRGVQGGDSTSHRRKEDNRGQVDQAAFAAAGKARAAIGGGNGD